MTETNATTAVWQEVPDLTPAGADWPVERTVAGVPVLIFRTKSGYRACEPLCPHQKVPLRTGTLMSGDTMVRCSRHNFIFRLTDGAGVNCVGLRLKVYEVRERDGRLEIALPA
jgi:nitrite reductase/ring-hydroxylating ferredoxin subunit